MYNFSPPRVEMTSFVCVITIEGWDTGIFGTLLFIQWVPNLMKLFFLSYNIVPVRLTLWRPFKYRRNLH